MNRHLPIVLLLAIVSWGSPAVTVQGQDQSSALATQRIDEIISHHLKEKGLKPNDDIDDATFLRRVYLDIAGRIPTLEESESFHASPSATRRADLIETLLNSEAFVSHSLNWWSDVLRINDNFSNNSLGRVPMYAYRLWLRDAIRDNQPYDSMVKEMLASTGHIWDNGATGYYVRDRGMPLDNMSNTIRVFLGVRLECAQCHDHPFDKWTQMDYFKMAAFSYGMDAARQESPNRDAFTAMYREEATKRYQAVVGKGFPDPGQVRDVDRFLQRPRGQRWVADLGLTEEEFREKVKAGRAAYENGPTDQAQSTYLLNQLYQQVRYAGVRTRQRPLRLPHDYQYDDADPYQQVEPAVMFGKEIDLDAIDGEAIDAYAAWLASAENPTFTRVIANRLWKRAFGVGLIEPVDDLNDNTQASIPALMSYLETLMVELNYDTREFLSIVYHTSAYQRAASTTELPLGHPYHFEGPLLRRMTAEQVWDSLVALSIPEVDRYRPHLKQQLAGIEDSKNLYLSLEGIGREEYWDMMARLGDELEHLIPQQREMRAAVREAIVAKDSDQVVKLRQELRQLDREMRRRSREIVYGDRRKPANGRQLLESAGMMEVAEGMMGDGPMPEDAVVTKLSLNEKLTAPDGLSEYETKRFRDDQRRDRRRYGRDVVSMARASELPFPAPPGHFLREFGQSDREVIDNSSQEASVPQALNLMNGPVFVTLMNRFSNFGKRLYEAEAGDPTMNMIFQAMLTRPPTPHEASIVREQYEHRGVRANEDIVWAILNTRQFLFIQ